MVVFLHLLIAQVEVGSGFRVVTISFYHAPSCLDCQRSDLLRWRQKDTTTHSTPYGKFRRSTTASRTKRNSRDSFQERQRIVQKQHNFTDLHHNPERMSRSICESLGLRRLTVLETMVLLTVMITGIFSMSTVTLTKVVLGTSLSYVTILSLPFLERAVDRLQG